MPETATPEVKREKVFIPEKMSVDKIQKKYSLKRPAARRAKKNGFFVKNYSKKQIIIDRENFNPAIAYNLAKKVYYKNFRFKYKIAPELKEDLVQEAWVRLYELSGKTSTTSKYDDNYCRFWIAHNAMLSFIKTWEKQVRYKKIWKNAADVIRCYPELTFSSNFTTC